MTILIVDDSPDDQQLLKLLLTKGGYKDLAFASSAHEAFELLGLNNPWPETQNSPYILILMDVIMPGMDGIQACRHIKKSGFSDLPIIIITGEGDMKTLSSAFKAGAIDHITKPYNKIELMVRVNSVLSLSQAHHDLQRREKMLGDLTDALDEGLLSLDKDGKIAFLNPAAQRLLGWERAAVLGKTIQQLAQEHPTNLPIPPPTECFLNHILPSGWERQSAESQFTRLDGQQFPVFFIASPIFEDGVPIGTVITFRDITLQKKSEERLRLAAKVITSSQEGIFITSPDAVILEINPAFTQVTGYTKEEAVGQTPRLLKSGRQDQAFYHEMWTTLKAQGYWQGEIWNRRKNGDIYPELLSINAISDDNGTVSHYMGVFFDITARKLAEQRLQHLAHHDVLTGLPNRLLFRDRLQHALYQAKRNGSSLALLFVDLDRFKPINDELGHEAGDHVLKEISFRLTHTIRASDTVSRMGGDEFAVVLQDILDRDDAGNVAQKIIENISQPITFQDAQCSVGASVGISLFPHNGTTLDTLLKNADMAMYKAKEDGRSCFRFYSDPKSTPPSA